MRFDKRWWLAGGLASAALAVWAPRLLARTNDAAPRVGDGGNAPAFLGAAEPGGAPAELAVPAAQPAYSIAAIGGPLERVSALEQMLPRLRNFGVGGPRPDLDALLARCAAAPAAAPLDSTTTTAAMLVPASAAPPADAAKASRESLAALAQRARLSACLAGARRPSAVLDGRVVREQDELEGGIVVEAIRARSIVLRRGDERVELALARRSAASAAPTDPTPPSEHP